MFVKACMAYHEKILVEVVMTGADISDNQAMSYASDDCDMVFWWAVALPCLFADSCPKACRQDDFSQAERLVENDMRNAAVMV